MSRAVVFFWVCAPLALVLACGQPFAATTEPEAAAGAADVGDGARGGVLGLGGHGVVSKPLNGGTVSSEGGESTQTSGGAPDVVDSAGAPSAGGTPPVVMIGENGCPELGGEKLVRAGSFCIDENEVTAAHYQAFVDSQPSVVDQPTACMKNTTFANNCKTMDPEKQPQRCVDWCDAHAYCKSVGKRLCGDSDGGAMAYDAAVISTDNQWFAACSHGGEVAYPYGNDYDSAACWGADRPPVGALTVKSASGCVGGYEGLWDMSGGLAEWVDSCNGTTGVGDACHIRGGSFSGTSDQLRCDWQSGAPRDTSSNYIGFRCCADLPAP
jgi:formylglycine-generating enzyme required for sulfatase activity